MCQETHRYEGEGVTVIWTPHLCIHCGNCARGLPAVFRPRERPWVNVKMASGEQIKAQIDKCPSGALSYDK